MTTETPTPSLFQHVLRTYNLMLSEAHEAVNDEGATIIVWEGMLVNLVTHKLNLSVPYYTHITNALKRMGCASQLKRGGGSGMSIWELHRTPTLALFDANVPNRRQRKTTLELLRGELDTMGNRVARLERALQRIIDEEEAQDADNL